MALARQGEFGVRFTSNGVGQVVTEIGSVGRASATAGKQLDDAGAAAQGAGSKFGELGSLARSALGGIGLAAVVQFATRSIVEFQKLEGQVTTFTGSFDKTRELFARFRADNAATSLNVSESAAAWVTLRTQGIEPTTERLRAIGNIAAQSGKSVEEVAAAFGQAARGQFRSLTQLGAQFKEVNDQIVVTFTDGTQRIINSSEDAIAAVVRLGNVDLDGAKSRDAETLAGAFGDVKNAASELAVTLGGGSGLTQNLTEAAKFITTLTSGLRTGAEFASEAAQQYDRVAEVLDRVRIAIGLISFSDLNAGLDAVGNVLQNKVLRDSDTSGGPRAEVGGSVGGRVGVDQGQITITNELSKATKDLIANVVELTEAEGKSRVELLQLVKARALAKAETDAARAAIAKAFDGQIAAAKATEQREIAERAQAKATVESAKVARDAERADRERAATLERVTQQTRALIAEMEPGRVVLMEYEDNVLTLIEAFREGVIPLEEFQKRVAELTRKRNADLAIESLAGTPRQAKSLAEKQAEAYAEEWDRVITGIGDLLTEVLVDRFGEAGGVVSELLQEITGLQGRGERLTNNVTRGSQALGRGFELDPDFVGPATAQGNANQSAGNQNIGSVVTQVAVAVAPQLGAAIGGGGESAQLGAQIGGAIGSIYGPIGTLVGSLLGGLIGGAFDDTPRITVSGNTRGQERTGRSSLGTFGASTRDTDLPVADLIEAVRRVDDALAANLTASERAAASTALRGFSASSSGDDLSIEEVLRKRVALIISTVEPAFAPFLNSIEDIEERIRQFEGLRVIKQQIDDIDRIAIEAFGDPVEQQTARLGRLQEAVTKAGDALATAIDAQDFADAAQASQDYQQAILALAQAQIEAAVQLEQALIDIDRNGRAFELNLLQRLANLPGGNPTTVVSQLRGNIDITRAGVLNSRTTEQSLAYLNEFIGTVDAWLQQATADVQRLLQIQLQALDTERDGILADAQLRLDAANAYNASISELERDRNRAMIEALQQQLATAQQWETVLERSEQLLDELRFGAANPVGLQSQFSNLGTEADGLFAQFNTTRGSGRVDIANRLLEILQQQQQVGASLFDRPSDESVALYNQIIARINAVRDVAQPEADRVAEIQNRIADLQAQTVGAVTVLTDATYFLSEDERARLEEIEEERRLAEEAAQAALDEINETAADYYRWAQTQGVALQNQQRQILQDQLDTLTDGVDVQTFILNVQAQSRNYLEEIRDDLRTFLDSIATVGGIVGPGGPGGGGPGPGGGGPSDPSEPAGSAAVITIGDINVTTGSGDPAQIGAAVRTAIMDQLPVLASAIKRELKTA